MRTKRMLRYFCDYCSKSGGRRDSMRKHESGCTLNPNRRCKMCALMHEWVNDDERASLKELIQIIDDAHFTMPQLNGDKILELIRKKTDCPACTLAAIRQSKANQYDECDNTSTLWIPEFSFKKESEKVMGIAFSNQRADTERLCTY